MEILIVEDEIQIREMLAFYIQENYESIEQIHIARNVHEAKQTLIHNDIDLCFTDHFLPDGSGKDVLTLLEKSSFPTKFILMNEDSCAETIVHYPSESVFYFFQKPDLLSSFEQFLVKCEKENVPLRKRIFKHSYTMVTLDFLIVIGTLPCDVFIKLSGDKFLKCMNKGDLFQEIDKAKYVNKKVNRLYLKFDEENSEMFADAVKLAIGRIADKKTVPFEDKIALIHNQVIGMLKVNGMTPELGELTKLSVQKSVQLISKNEALSDFWKNLRLMGDYPAKLYTLQSVLACLILKELQWNSENTFYKLSLCAFLQDVTLMNLKLIKIKHYDEFLKMKDQLASEEVKNFLDHPFKAKELINTLKGLPPDVDKIVMEQLELPNGEGYPRQLNALTLGKLSCVFILTGYIARELLEKGKDFSPTGIMEHMESEGYARGNFNEPFKVAKKVFGTF